PRRRPRRAGDGRRRRAGRGRRKGRVNAAAPEGGVERFPRSRFLELATLGLGGVIAMAVTLPVAAVSVLGAFVGQRRHTADLGPVDAFPEGQFVVATFLTDPEAGRISRRTAYIRNNGLLGNRPSFTVMSSRCTHVGCPTQPNGPVFLDQRKLERAAGSEI